MNYSSDIIMVVAQEPFEIENNQFCKLVPVLYPDGTRPSPDDFPNDGEIWWMVTAQTSHLAVPGNLVIGVVEQANRYSENDPASSRYQVLRESVKQLDTKLGLEVIDIPTGAIENIQEIVSSSFKLEVSQRPTSSIMIRWKSEIVGPFAVSTDAYFLSKLSNTVSLTPADPKMVVFKLSSDRFETTVNGFLANISTDVSTTAQRRAQTFPLKVVKHQLLLRAGYEKFMADATDKVVLEPIGRKLTRLAKDFLGRKKKQELRRLLEEIEIPGRETPETEDLIATINQFHNMIAKEDAALNRLADALLESGLLGEDRVEKAEQKYSELYIQERTAALQAHIQDNISSKTIELGKLEAEVRDVKRRLQDEETQTRELFRKELLLERERAEAEIAADRDNLATQSKELERQQELLQKNLQQVTNELRDAGDDVVNRFLTIAPFLGVAGIIAGRNATKEPASFEPLKPSNAPTHFELPKFVTRNIALTEQVLSEEVFFDRFVQVVENSGFVYRPLDLVRFHLSVKVGAITVLGGPSGTGKSSLPLLYGRALLGDEADNDRTDCLMVNVNPSWMEVRDVLGHMNTLEGRFYPSESGMFQYLVYAQEEFKERGTSSAIHIACLDEMNLAQVEHYLGDLMMSLEREGEHRGIRCFSPEVASLDCMFREWSRIKLSPALRIIGTVNFDETTRLLSDRFLDRANLIHLRPSMLPSVSNSTDSVLARSTGPIVTMADFESWQGYNIMPTELAALLDDMRPILQQLGCPISPRVYRAICRFVGSCTHLIPPAKAFDVQIAQRVLPKIRSLITKRQLDSLDALLRLFKENNVCAFDETLLMLEEMRDASLSRDWAIEEY